MIDKLKIKTCLDRNEEAILLHSVCTLNSKIVFFTFPAILIDLMSELAFSVVKSCRISEWKFVLLLLLLIRTHFLFSFSTFLSTSSLN